MQNDFSCDDFKKAIENIHEFMAEQQKLDAVIKVISPTSTGVVEFGNKILEHYIHSIEKLVGDDGEWISWFIFERCFGAKPAMVKVNGEEFELSTVDQLYYAITAKQK